MRSVRLSCVIAPVVLLGVLSARPPASAQPPDAPAAVTLEAALRRALQRHPALESASRLVEAADGRVRQAGTRPNPELEVELENVSGDLPGVAESEATVQLSQRLETGGKRGARRAVARADRALAGRDLEAARLDLVRDVRIDFALALGADRQLALAEETLTIAREIAETAERKVEAGALPAVEATRARVSIAAAEIEAERARGAARLARERLALHWGGEPVAERVEGSLDSLSAVPNAGAAIARLPENPDLARWADEDAAQRARLRLERSQRALDLELSGGYRRLAAEERGTFVVGLSAELPLLDRNRGGIAAAAAEAERATFEEERARRALERDLRDVLVRLEIAQVEVRELRRRVLPGAQDVYDGVRLGYEQGRFTYLDVLEARRFLAGAKEAEIAALVELEQRRIEVERLTGHGEDLIERVMEERP